MDITCPNCGSHYKLNPRRIGEAGRKVKCMQCHHVWQVSAPDISLDSADNALGRREAEYAAGVRDTEDSATSSIWRKVAVWLFSMLLLLFLLVTLLLVFRYPIASFSPTMGNFLSSHGIIAPDWLEIKHYTMMHTRDGMEVQTELHSTDLSNRVSEHVKLHVSLLDSTGAVLHEHYSDINQQRIRAYGKDMVITEFQAHAAAVDSISISIKDCVHIQSHNAAKAVKGWFE